MVEMNLFLVFCYILIGEIDVSLATGTTAVTEGVDVRIALLKLQLADQVKPKYYEQSTEKLPIEDSTPIDENIEYVDHEKEAVTPINENDPRKLKERYKLNEIKTTLDLGQNFRDDSEALRIKHRLEDFERSGPGELLPVVKKNGRNRKIKKSKITDIFYRRVFSNENAKGWTHCQGLITPFLAGHKTNISVTKRIVYNDPVVLRLIQLLTEDITDHTKDDIHSILYQISNLQIRLFQWDLTAIKLLLNVIIKEKVINGNQKQSFKTIKMGLKHIFNTWNLHFGSDITVLLRQTRIFRPPCVKITENEGSTKTSHSIRYTKSKKAKCIKAEYDDCED